MGLHQLRILIKLPFPERDKFYGINDNEKKIDVSYINTIRGCPYKCTYCASPFHWDRRTTELNHRDQ